MPNSKVCLITVNFLPPANCGEPTIPGNGSIRTYQNTTEGAEIVFGCNPMFAPSAMVTATCASNGMWSPDPASHMCTCEYLLCIAVGGLKGLR